MLKRPHCLAVDAMLMIPNLSDVTGPASATTGIISFYDIFGLLPQIIQGADILAYSNTERPSLVFMPDFLKGNTASFSWYPPDTEEKQAIAGAWMGENLSPPKHLPMLQEVVDAASKAYPQISSWGIIGYCYGGKIVAIVGGLDSRFKAGIQTSPALVDPTDAEKVKIPMMMLASQDEPAEDVKKFGDALTVTKHIETFSDQPHGWMSARADFSDAKMKADYERGYRLAVEFFHSNL